MNQIKAKVIATTSTEMIVTLRKYEDGSIELEEVVEILDVHDIDDIEVLVEL